MKYLLFFFILAQSTLSFSQSLTDTIDCHWLLKSSDFTVVKTVQEIAPWVFVKFSEWEKMSNPKKKFNATDNGGGPKRRLFFAAHCEDNWIVSFEHGGRGYHTHCFFITVNNRNEIAVFHCNNEFKTIDALKTAAFTGTFLFEIWDGNDL